MKKLIVTRHQALAQYIIKHKLAPEGTPVLSHVRPSDISGRHVLGTLPLHLALKYPSRITIVPFHIPSSLKGKELVLEDLEELAEDAKTFEIQEIPTQLHV